MSLTHKDRWRVVLAIRSELQALEERMRARALPATTRFLDDVRQVAPIIRRLSHCDRRGWLGAGRRVRRDLAGRLHGLAMHLDGLLRVADDRAVAVPSPGNVYRDLVQCEDEFVDVQLADDHLCATTEPIELEGIYLGEFSVELDVPSLHTLGIEPVYRVVAQDPHPAATNDAVTHPHLSEERLCAGDAAAAIEAALSQGRICDFFVLVRSVLTHYNPGSPYVALSDWTGMPCHDCGDLLSEDNTFCCAICERDFCGECASYCRVCHDGTCNECLSECPICDEPTCPACLTDCSECGEPLCQTCKTKERCPCLETETEDSDDEMEQDQQTPGEAQVDDRAVAVP